MFWPQANSTSLRDTKPNDIIVIAITINSTTSRATPGLANLFLLVFILIIIAYNISAAVEQVSRPTAKCGVNLALTGNAVLSNVK